MKNGFNEWVADERNSAILQAFNDVDPFHCYYGDEINPDEYFGYAKRMTTLLSEREIAYYCDEGDLQEMY